MRRVTILTLILAALVLGGSSSLAASDPQAVAMAESVMEKMGGADAWADTRFVSWNFFGFRRHWWDRQTGDLRIEWQDRDGTKNLVLMNAHTKAGRAWKNGEELSADALTDMLDGGHKAWINDAYWMFMPYKLLDPGVTLADGGPRKMEDGRDAHVLEMTFGDGIGYTPQNKYLVWIGKESGLVEAWTFYADRNDAEPRFTSPWTKWEKFGDIMLATDHGRGADWDIAVHDLLERSVFEDPAPVN